MFKIAIVEDENLQAEYIMMLINKWSKQYDAIIQLDAYKNAEEFLFKMEDGLGYDLLLLDIQLDKMSGISLAKHLRDINDDVKIIFTTAIKDYVFDGYDLDAVNYLIKPIKYDKLTKSLNKVYAMLSDNEDYIIIDNIKYFTSKILYFEAIGHNTKCVCMADEYMLKINITRLENTLSDLFYKCHRSYIVNIHKVKQIKRQDIIMDNGIIVPLSRGNVSTMNKRFSEHFTKDYRI